MKKSGYFATREIEGWPRPDEIERYFLAPPGQRWFFETRNDTASFKVDGIGGTEHLDPDNDRVSIDLSLWGDPQHGVLLIWHKYGGPFQEMFSSKGDLTRLREFVRTLHHDLMPVGLYVPFDVAWKAVKEFLENEGALPKSIEWIDNDELPPGVFPLPHEMPWIK